MLASGSFRRFQKWLSCSWSHLKGTRLILVPYGKESNSISEIAPSDAEVCQPGENTSLEANRNTALSYLDSSEHPKLVAFLDDDTFVGHEWLNEILSAVNGNHTTDAFASIVSSFNKNEIQSCGHFFNKAAPLEFLQKHGNPLCPCGNCAVVRWSALQKIREVNPNYWDPRFKQWQTCFDFGLKLVLTNSTTLLVREATAQHQGFLTWNEEEKEKRKNTAPFQQLRSRFLLYKKFLPENLETQVEEGMTRRANLWQQRGYPKFERHLKGVELNDIIVNAKRDADNLWRKQPDEIWKKLMEKTQTSSAIWGFDG